jgi:hypothetical protein
MLIYNWTNNGNNVSLNSPYTWYPPADGVYYVSVAVSDGFETVTASSTLTTTAPVDGSFSLAKNLRGEWLYMFTMIDTYEHRYVPNRIEAPSDPNDDNSVSGFNEYIMLSQAEIVPRASTIQYWNQVLS